MQIWFRRALIFSLLCGGFAIPNRGAADEGLMEQINVRLLDESQTWSEVRAFVERRVPPVPAADSVDTWRVIAEQLRNDMLRSVIFRGAAEQWRAYSSRVEYLETVPCESAGYSLRKLRYEALPGLWIPAVLYEPWNVGRADSAQRVPVVLNFNGHDPLGKAAIYKQMRCIHLAKQGYLALNVEWLGMGQLKTKGFTHGRMNQLDLCGTSGLAPFYLAMERALDLLLAHPHADSQRVAVAGLSGGGWQTILLSALDPRVTLSNPVAGYSGLVTRVHHISDLGDSEQTPVDMATVADYTHLTAMRAPRPTLLTFNAKDDCCFAAAHALPPLLAAATPVFERFGRADHLREHVNHDPGNHNFERENRQAFYQMLAEHFSQATANFSVEEQDYADELKTAEQLNVLMPDENADFHQLAVQLAAQLPCGESRPDDELEIVGWRERRRIALRRLTATHHYEVQARAVSSVKSPSTSFHCWKIRIGNEWTIGVREWTPAAPNGTTILLADTGRTALSDRITDLLNAGQRVLNFDPFFFGECGIRDRDYLAALLISAVGERPLGVQTSQLIAVADWSAQRFGRGVRLQTVGPRMGLIGLLAQVLASEFIDDIAIFDGPVSLKQVIEEDMSFEQRPEWFCFGLLEQFDIDAMKQLARIVE